MQEIIAVGNKIEMELLVNGEPITDKEKRRTLLCRIMDLPGVSLIRVTMPFHEGRIVPLAIGDQYQVTVLSQKGIYSCPCVVVRRLKEGNLFLADMEMQAALKKVQRREFFRHECRLPAQYRIVANAEEELSEAELESQEWKKGVILDISGGGVRLISEYKEEAKQLIQVRFPMTVEGEKKECFQYGQLLTSIPNTNNKILYEQRIEFERIGDKEREVIIRYIFDEERKRISKEKGLNS